MSKHAEEMNPLVQVHGSRNVFQEEHNLVFNAKKVLQSALVAGKFFFRHELRTGQFTALLISLIIEARKFLKKIGMNKYSEECSLQKFRPSI